MSDGHDIHADLVIALQTQDLISFKEAFQSCKIDLLEIQDHNKSTIFHEISKSCIRESSLMEFLELTISFFKNHYSESASKKISRMLNQVNLDENITALQSAVKQGKLKIIKEFLRLGGDPQLKTSNNSLVHLCSRQGSMQVLAYLKYELKCDINELADNKMNCLHIASQAGNEYVVLSLIAWGCDVNGKDIKNNSPLHYAALNGNYKIIRALILGGSERSAKNNDGETALAIAQRSGNSDLISILKTPSLIARINPFKHPIKPVKNSYKLYTFFVVLFIFRYILVLCYIVPHLDVEFELTSLVIFLLSTISFMMVSHSDPGYIKHSNKETMFFLYQTFQAEFLCPFCECKKPPKARHCFYCNRCVKRYDHHCPWIRNCVGKNNHRLFIFFIVCISIDFLYNAVVGILDYLGIITQRHIRVLRINDYYPEAALTISVISLLSFIFAFPVCLVQITNAIKNKTTHERFAFKDARSTATAKSGSLPSMALIRSEEDLPVPSNFVDNITTSCCYSTKRTNKEMLLT